MTPQKVPGVHGPRETIALHPSMAGPLIDGSTERPLPALLRALLVPWNLLMMSACFTMFTWIVHDRRMPGWPDALDRVKHGPLLRVGGGVVVAAPLGGALRA